MRTPATLIPLLALLVCGCSASDATSDSTDPDGGGTAGSGGAATVPYPIVDTAQAYCYNSSTAFSCPGASDPLNGQDAQFQGNQPSYMLSSDKLTVYDNVTGLTWQHSPDLNGDGVITVDDKLSFAEASLRCNDINATKIGGFDDWRLPSIKELYSLIQFNGTDPSGLTTTDTSGLTPFIDAAYFQFGYGDTNAGERIIDSQYASSTLYVNKSWTGADQLFGVNFADGRIKGYDLKMPNGTEKTFLVMCVRGNTSYGINVLVDNGDQTITDKATGLMWAKDDSTVAMDWQASLVWVQSKNAENYLGHNDWRMPNAKELQSILDYTRSPDTTQSAAIDPIFSATSFTNEDGKADFPWYWASTTHAKDNGMGSGVYVAFGRAGGWQKVPASATCYTLKDVHGAGAQRSDPKTSANLTVIGQACSGGTAYGFGPQGDSLRGSNYVRLTRNGAVPGEVDAGPPPDSSLPSQDGGPPIDAGDGGLGPKSCVAQSDCEAVGACPGTLGCSCTQTPGGKACVPKCNTTADCPTPPDVTLTCSNGLCTPE